MAVIAGLCCVGALLGIAVLAVLTGGVRGATVAFYAASLAISSAALLFALHHLLFGAAVADVTLPLGLPWVGAHFHVDALAAFFLAVVNLGGASASLYGIGYGRHEHEPLRVLPFFPAFLAGMNLVVLAADAFSFLVAWEFMSLASWALVMAHHKEAGNREAGYVYIVMASAGTLALLLAFGLLAGPEGGYAFEAIRAHKISSIRAGLVLCLALLGTGSKAGLVPLHIWLPLAHPAAPSHVSALMSGVMTKVAIYGFLRIIFDLLGPETQWWWGLPILAAGGGTAVLGILYALMQVDVKRVLAYSTIENIGVIFAGLGLALAFDTNGWPAAGALALTAALFHVFNHALFKSILFFGAGAVLTATGERSMDRLGGLIHAMPVTSFAFLVACAAISALPPLNGFASEWLLFQAILLSPGLPHWGLKLLIPAVGALLALAAAMAAACFVRVFGIVFLGRPRSVAAERAAEVDRWSHGAMIALAVLCVLAGILPGFVIDAMAPVVQSVTGARMPAQAGMDGCRSCRSPRAAVLIMDWSCFSSSPYLLRSRLMSFIALPRTQFAARPPGAAAFQNEARRHNIRRGVSPSRSAGCLAPMCFAPARLSRCGRPATSLRRGSKSSCMISPGSLFTRLSPMRFRSPPRGSISFSS